MSRADAILFAAVSEKPNCLTICAKLPTMKQVDFVVKGKNSMRNLTSFVGQSVQSLGNHCCGVSVELPRPPRVGAALPRPPRVDAALPRPRRVGAPLPRLR
eukprot:jgi/Tetstr1/465844/TSEL_010464.t1